MVDEDIHYPLPIVYHEKFFFLSFLCYFLFSLSLSCTRARCYVSARLLRNIEYLGARRVVNPDNSSCLDSWIEDQQ